MMPVDYSLSPDAQAEFLVDLFNQQILHHERTHVTDNMDASTFTDAERCAMVVVDLMSTDSDLKEYWYKVSQAIENR